MNLIAGDGGIVQENVVAGIAGNHVARRSSGTADGVIRGAGPAGAVKTYEYAGDTLAYATASQRRRAGHVDADVVALNRGPARAGPVDQNSGVVPRNNVARGGSGSADDVVRRAFDVDAVIAVRGRRSAGGIQPEETTLDRVAAVRLQCDGNRGAIAVEIVDDQTAHGAVPGGDDQSLERGAVPVQLDAMQGVFAHSQGIRTRPRLRVAVDDERIGDGGKR